MEKFIFKTSDMLQLGYCGRMTEEKIPCLGEDLEMLIRGLKKSYLEKFRGSRRDYLLRRLNEYGLTRTERIENMRAHMLQCAGCRRGYSQYLNSRAEEAKKAVTEMQKRDTTILEDVPYCTSYIELIEGYDFLRLLPELKKQAK